MSVPSVLPAPGRLSTTAVVPNASVRRCATNRAAISLPPPGENGTTSRTGLDGYESAACRGQRGGGERQTADQNM
jgi:hypothetical protein